ncbi:MAG TPA: hypothetical protein H9945_07430, partial [Candidatus Gemmiger avicola]|nr:hypothetical protein [Candidatus Gemmiger avicola]
MQDHYTTHQRGMQSVFGPKSIFQRYLQGNSSIFGHLDQTPIPAAARPSHRKIREKDSFYRVFCRFFACFPASLTPRDLLAAGAITGEERPVLDVNVHFSGHPALDFAPSFCYTIIDQ